MLNASGISILGELTECTFFQCRIRWTNAEFSVPVLISTVINSSLCFEIVNLGFLSPLLVCMCAGNCKPVPYPLGKAGDTRHQRDVYAINPFPHWLN